MYCVVKKAKCIVQVHFLRDWMNKFKEYSSKNVRFGYMMGEIKNVGGCQKKGVEEKIA